MHSHRRQSTARLSHAILVMAIGGPIGALIAGPRAQAAPVLNVTLNSPATIASCNTTGHGAPPTGVNCYSAAFQPVLASQTSTFITGNFDGAAPTTQTFATAFNAWNVANGSAWTLINGGNLDVTFTVTDTASAAANLGGISTFSVAVTKNGGYAGPATSQLVWSQGLYVSYGTKPPYPVDTTYNTMDTYSFSQGNTGSGGAFTNACVAIPGQTPGPNNTTPATIGATPANSAYCDPIYPFQDGAAGFFDGPQAYWPDESFRAIALLSTVTFKTDAGGNITERDLTVYNGVSWGFDLAVPEPASLLLFAPSAALVGLIRRRKQRSDITARS